MAQQIGAVTKGIGSAFRTVVIIYAISIGFTVLLLIIAVFFDNLGIFPQGFNPFVLLYNSVRNITLFLLVFPPAFAIVTGAWFLDIVLPILAEILNGVFTTFNIPISLPEEFDLITAAESLVATIQDLVNTLFPPLEQ